MKSKRFEPIREIAKTSAKDSGRAMGEAGREVADLERQPEQLKSYRDEYVRNSQSSGAIDAVELHQLPFLYGSSRRSDAPTCDSLEKARAEYEKRREQWSEKRIEAERLSLVVDRFRKEEHHAADRPEQREGDEAAVRASLAARGEA